MGNRIEVLRKERGISQEELAKKLNVVRQTVSKWEKGLSAPDADMLVRIAQVFGISVGELLGESEEGPAEALEKANKQIAHLQESRRKRLRAFWICMAAAAGLLLICWLAVFLSQQIAMHQVKELNGGIIGGADGPTSIYITSRLLPAGRILPPVLYAGGIAAAVIGIIRTAKK